MNTFSKLALTGIVLYSLTKMCTADFEPTPTRKVNGREYYVVEREVESTPTEIDKSGTTIDWEPKYAIAHGNTYIPITRQNLFIFDGQGTMMWTQFPYDFEQTIRWKPYGNHSRLPLAVDIGDTLIPITDDNLLIDLDMLGYGKTNL